MINSRSDLDDVSLVTVTYNSENMAKYFQKTAKFLKNIYIVDNGSKDQTFDYFKKISNNLNFTQLDLNIGFGPANNIGFKQSIKNGASFTLFLNPDCYIDQESIKQLRTALEQNPLIGLICPVVSDGHGIKNSILQWDFTKPYNKKSPKIQDIQSIQSEIVENSCIDGSCFLVRSSIFSEIGGFNENLFMYCEEDDISLRLARAGYGVATHTHADAVHLKSASTPQSVRIKLRKAYHVRLSRFIMVNTYIDSKQRILEALKVFFISPFAIIFFCLTFQKKNSIKWTGWMAASIDGIFLTKFFRKVF
jgi:GT2 family glycosyltransferase